MPFSSSISCSHFQAFSNAVAHIMKVKTKKDNVNYLDDFLFIALMAWACNQQMQLFLHICDEIQFPVSLDKTCWATQVITFLGMLLDAKNQIMSIPKEKIEKALDQIEVIVGKQKHKATVLQIQKLCGLLNFICRAIIPGQSFMMRLYSSFRGWKTLKPHYHIKLAKDTILNLEVWKLFLNIPGAYC